MKVQEIATKYQESFEFLQARKKRQAEQLRLLSNMRREDQINSYNTLAQSDYQEMGKAKLDYEWCWDTLFFGRGYAETIRFDKKRKILQPHIINPLAFGYDPYIENYQDWRYYWKWITKTKWDLQ